MADPAHETFSTDPDYQQFFDALIAGSQGLGHTTKLLADGTTAAGRPTAN
jgi:hypothetical protein